MGTIAVIEATVDATISTGTGDSDFVDVVTTENLVEGKVYHVICSAAVSTNNSDELFEWRLYDETNSEFLDGSHLELMMAQAGVPQPYYFVGRITAGATTGGLVFQQKGYAEGSTEGYLPARTLFLSMLLLDMSGMDSGDHFYANDASAQIDGSPWADKVSHTVSDIEEDDEWLVFAGSETSINSLTRSPEARIDFSATVASRAPHIKFEGKDLEEQVLWWMCKSYSLNPLDVGGSVTWALQAREGSGTGAPSYTKNATLFGIKVSSLADSFMNYTQMGTSPSDTEYLELDSNIYTPTSDGKVIVAATSIFDAGGTNRTAGQRVQKKVTTIPNNVLDHTNFINTNDAGDALPLSYITVYDGVSGENETIAYDVRVGTYYSGISFKQHTLAMFGTTTIIADVTFSAVAKQVYTSGDVASETLVAGSKASQTLASGDVAGQGFASGDTASQSHSSGDVEAEANP